MVLLGVVAIDYRDAGRHAEALALDEETLRLMERGPASP